MTGIFASCASFSTVSQPVSTTGEKAMTSTFCAMNERMALIWFSCFCCASENRRSMPMVAAADLIDCVFAVRHSLSAPIWLKPSTMRWSSLPREQPASSARLRVMTVKMRREEFIASPMNVSERVGAAEGMAAGLDGEPVDQRRAQRRHIDLEFVAGLHADVV